ncbi:alpha/beta-hydrolase [Salix suchowensis]|nr:alpha/beta-hydrolase [Salix suchowensis]
MYCRRPRLVSRFWAPIPPEADHNLRGSQVTARLADLYEDRFIAFAFFAVGYVPPNPDFDLDQVLARTKQVVGFELLGYWKFFSEADAPALIEKNVRRSTITCDDASLWKTDLAPTGVFRSWIEAGKTTTVGPWISKEERKIHGDMLLKGGLAGPVCWYKVVTSGIMNDDDKGASSRVRNDINNHLLMRRSRLGVPIRSPAVSKPVFFGATSKDAVCIPKLQTPVTQKACPNLIVREFDSGHWVQLEKKDEVNKELGAWFTAVLA